MPDEVIRVEDEFYILASSARLDDRTRVMKHDDLFAVFDRAGDIEAHGPSEFGIYHHDTRFLSHLVLRMGEGRPMLLSSTLREDNSLLAVDLMNPHGWRDDDGPIPRGTVHVFRSKVLWEGACFERLRIENFGERPVTLTFGLEFAADFADIFEVRGTSRPRRGRPLPPQVSAADVILAYEGLDERKRRTHLRFDPAPRALSESVAEFEVRVEPRHRAEYRWTISCHLDPSGERSGLVPTRPVNGVASGPPIGFAQAVQAVSEAITAARSLEADIYTSNEQFNDWLNRSIADLHMLHTRTPYGLYPYAGVPWFSTAFGRDGIILALETLWFNPDIARGVLSYLAATQADDTNDERDSQPGKILHEVRGGEMAALGEVPFGRYYGSVDATPLFVLLAGEYFRSTGDLAFVQSLWPHVERALEWMDHRGDLDGDAFLEYARRGRHGLVHQGWKDSHDSVFHEDGTPAEPPIALSEVQGYAFAARRVAADLATALGLAERAMALRQAATSLRDKFERTFWCDDLDMYALALDRAKQPCRVRSSNAGQCLYTGIADDDRARRVAARLMGEAMFSGWGIRTIAADAPRYNPMSYHNGSVWPHDNALIAAGLARYGLKDEAVRILERLFDASLFFDLHRLPELFCGFRRRPGEGPTLYPVACSPQAWASGAVFMLLQACLGLEVRGAEGLVVFSRPLLPPFLQRLRIRGLRVGQARVDLDLRRHGSDVGVNVTDRQGEVTVMSIK